MSDIACNVNYKNKILGILSLIILGNTINIEFTLYKDLDVVDVVSDNRIKIL